MITGEQCRAARGLLGWTQQDLAAHAEIGIVTIRNFENTKTVPYKGTVSLLRQAFEAAGIEFLAEDRAGEGVRFRCPRDVRGMAPQPSQTVGTDGRQAGEH